MGQLHEYVGATFTVSPSTISISQFDLIKTIQPKRHNVELTPASQGFVLLPDPTSRDLNDVEMKDFRSQVGKCLYLAKLSRPDIANALRELSRFMSQAKESAQVPLERLLRYIQSTNELKLTFHKPNMEEIVIQAFSDANYASDKITRRSVTGYVIFLCGNLVMWRSNMQKCVTLSSTESEYVALSMCVQDILFLKQLLESLHLNVSTPIKIYVDNTGSIDLANSWSSTGRSKHIDIRHHFIRDLVDQKTIELSFVPSDDNLADSFTKNIDQSRFLSHRSSLLDGMKTFE